MRRVLLVLLLLGGCTQRGAPRDHVLRIAATGSLEPITPRLDGTFSMMVKGQVFDLFISPTEGGWHSRVLSTWRWESPRELRFQLRRELRFSDGSPVRVEDAVESLRAASLEVDVDGDWLRVHSDSPLEQRLLKAVLFKQVGAQSLGTGAFAVERGDARHLWLRRVGRTERGVSAIELTSVDSPREAFARTLSGEANLLLMPDTGEIELLDGVPQLQLVHANGIHALAAYFNPTRIGRNDRRALVAGVATGPIARAYGSGCGPIGSAVTQPLAPGRPLGILIAPLLPGIHRAALALQRALGARGGAIEELPTSEVIDRDHHREFDLIIAPVLVWPRSAFAIAWKSTSPQNQTGYASPELDRAVDSGDPRELEQALADDPPMLFICRLERTMAVDARLTNVRIGPYDFLESLPDWEFQE